MRAIYAYRPWDPTSYPAGIEARAPAILESWIKRFPESQPTNRDGDDWIENAVLVHEADRLGLPLTILESKGDGIFVTGGGCMGPPARPDAPAGFMIGQWARRDLMQGLPIDMDSVGTTATSCSIASGYAASATFQRHAGRPVALANGDVGGENGIEAALRAVVDAQGHGHLFVKTVAKGWATRVDVDPEAGGLWRQLVKADAANEDDGLGLAWIPVQHEGSSTPVLLVQGIIEPTFEYRMFVVDGKPVTGSGCIEAFTPAENEEVFDAKMERVRSDGSVVAMPELRDRYLAFAQAYCDAFAEEHGPGLDMSVDLCIDGATDKIVVIEQNPSTNLGRYASDVGIWLAAAVERTERVAVERSNG